MTTLYTATATATGGREGRVRTDDGTLDLAVTMPRGLGGAGLPGTNPEQLFAAGYSACFGSALGLVARMQKVNPGPFAITAEVSLDKAGAGYQLRVALHGRFDDLPREQAEALMTAAHTVCPYSNATRGNIEVTLVVD